MTAKLDHATQTTVSEMNVLGTYFRTKEKKTTSTVTRDGVTEVVGENAECELTLGNQILCTSADAGLVREAMLRLAVELMLDRAREMLKGLRYVGKP